MKSVVRTLIMVGIFGLIIVFVVIGNSDIFQEINSAKNNLNKPTKLTFLKVPFFPVPLGEVQTPILNFRIDAKGPSGIKFDQGNHIIVEISGTNVSEKITCELRDDKETDRIYATDTLKISSNFKGYDGKNIGTGQIDFRNFGQNGNQSIIVEPDGMIDLDITCNTTTLKKNSDLTAIIRSPNSIIYDTTGVMTLDQIAGNTSFISGLPLKTQPLSSKL